MECFGCLSVGDFEQKNIDQLCTFLKQKWNDIFLRIKGIHIVNLKKQKMYMSQY